MAHESVAEELVVELTASIEKAYSSDVQASSDYCRIINDNHFNRIKGILDDAVEQGAELAYGGSVDDTDRFINPTIIVKPTEDSRVMDEEIFGPLLPVLTYSEIDEVIGLINSKPKPLALYLYSKNSETIDRVLSETSAGDTCVNHNVLHFLHLNLSFGGVNNSGLGKAHGVYGFKAFSHERSVLTEHFTITHMMFPPYTDKVQKLIKNTVRFF